VFGPPSPLPRLALVCYALAASLGRVIALSRRPAGGPTASELCLAAPRIKSCALGDEAVFEEERGSEISVGGSEQGRGHGTMQAGAGAGGARRAAGRSLPSFSEANDVRVRVVGDAVDAAADADTADAADSAEAAPLVAPPPRPAAASLAAPARSAGSSGGGMRPGRPFRSLAPSSATASAAAAATGADDSATDGGGGGGGESILAPHAAELARQDAALDRLSENLSRLGEVARDIGDEMSAQDVAIAQVQGVADRATAAVDEATRQVEAVVRRNGAEQWVPRLVWALALVLAAEVYYVLFM
jgi:hypothetical protein